MPDLLPWNGWRLQKSHSDVPDFDGKVDAFGVGGLEFYIKVANKCYYMRDVKRVSQAIKISKVGDGNGRPAACTSMQVSL